MRTNRLKTQKSASIKKIKGFTLLELLVVMVIIGLLVGYVAPKYFSQLGKSEVKVAKAQIDSLGKALDMYRLDTGHYPSTDSGLQALTTKPANEKTGLVPTLQKDCQQTHGVMLMFTAYQALMVRI